MATGGRLSLQENSSATGTTTFRWYGGPGLFMAEATWGGGTVKLQIQSPNSTWLDVATATANSATTFELPPGTVRAAITTATVVYAYAVSSPRA